MYLRGVHAESHIPTLQRFIKTNSLGLFTTAIAAPDLPFIQTSHIPWVLDVENESSQNGLGVLRGHIARQNPQSKAMIHAGLPTVSGGTDGGVKLDTDVLVLFTGSAYHYVTPKFYTETKSATGKVVWNHSAVQAYGKATVYFDKSKESKEFLAQQISHLSNHAETSKNPWKVPDALAPYVEIMQRNIIGIKIEIPSLGGKFKMSQEMGAKDCVGVIEGFENLGTEVGMDIAQSVLDRQNIMK
ncbi:hypothetical protein BTUL_0058g00540 [Botrytis tulipae]|uniref:Uncharacterized protein n=1 Tax=Botrytis tulipae TaxID=87230 RepID=A0A4Z1EP98_9HELO|nr:hypothetical protein BTUL_0058g00540 [Botrytis tulipae]